MITKKGIIKKNLFCGYEVNTKEQECLIKLTQAEFLVPIAKRRTPLELVNEAKNIIKYHNKWLKL